MKADRFRELYADFVRIYEDSEPCRSGLELLAAVGACEADGREDFDEKWLRSLNRAWVYRHSDTPFVDPTLNSRYFQILNARRELTSR